MSKDINNVTIAGRVVRDAELKYTNSGTAVCEFSIASNYSVKKGDRWEDEVNFFDATLFGKRAEALSKYLEKGKQIVIAGELQQQRWEQDGNKRSRVKIMVRDIQLVGGRSDGASQSSGGSGSQGGGGYDDGEDPPF